LDGRCDLGQQAHWQLHLCHVAGRRRGGRGGLPAAQARPAAGRLRGAGAVGPGAAASAAAAVASARLLRRAAPRGASGGGGGACRRLAGARHVLQAGQQRQEALQLGGADGRVGPRGGQADVGRAAGVCAAGLAQLLRRGRAGSGKAAVLGRRRCRHRSELHLLCARQLLLHPLLLPCGAGAARACGRCQNRALAAARPGARPRARQLPGRVEHQQLPAGCRSGAAGLPGRLRGLAVRTLPSWRGHHSGGALGACRRRPRGGPGRGPGRHLDLGPGALLPALLRALLLLLLLLLPLPLLLALLLPRATLRELHRLLHQPRAPGRDALGQRAAALAQQHRLRVLLRPDRHQHRVQQVLHLLLQGISPLAAASTRPSSRATGAAAGLAALRCHRRSRAVAALLLRQLQAGEEARQLPADGVGVAHVLHRQQVPLQHRA
jgi:hypothetical protein